MSVPAHPLNEMQRSLRAFSSILFKEIEEHPKDSVKKLA